jgi:two-component system nitrate/nitrite response regulator NarL
MRQLPYSCIPISVGYPYIRVEDVMVYAQQLEGTQAARIALIEDHAAVRQALAFVLEREPGLEVVAQAGTLAEARRFSADFDVAIVDLGLPDGHGTEAIRELRTINPKCAVLVLTANPHRTQFARAVEAGASGVLHKSTPLEEVAEAVRRLMAGEALLTSNEVIELLRLAASEREKDYHTRMAVQQLTRREKEILQGLAEGLNDREIAKQLHISFDTERSHMTNILAKLGADSRLQALVFAARSGIVEIR